jgi:hypothetical protein
VRRQPFECTERDCLQRNGAIACFRLRALDPAVPVRATDIDDACVAVDVAMLECDPLSGSQPSRGSEEDERPVAGSEFGGERIELRPGLERPLLRAPALWVIDAPLGRIHVDQSPADGAGEHLAERLRRLEAMA